MIFISHRENENTEGTKNFYYFLCASSFGLCVLCVKNRSLLITHYKFDPHNSAYG